MLKMTIVNYNASIMTSIMLPLYIVEVMKYLLVTMNFVNGQTLSFYYCVQLPGTGERTKGFTLLVLRL